MLIVIILIMEDDLLPSHLCTALMRIGTRLAAGFDHHFAPHGVTQAQFRVLLAIWEQGGAEGITPSALADYLLIERATVSVLTSRMVGRGWLERVPGKNRRTFRLVLTGRGRQALEEVIPHAVALANHTLSGITAEDLSRMLGNLESVEARLRADEGLKEDKGLEEPED